MKPRVLLVGRTRYRLPLNESLRRKFDALAEEVQPRVLASSADRSRGDETFTLVRRLPVLDGAAFWALLPARIARELRRRPTDAILAQSPYDGAAALLGRALARSRARIIVDVHGDWRTATRLYGSPLRRLLSPLGDRLSLAALRRADAVRSVSGYTEGLVREVGIEPAGVFPAFMDLDPFLADPVAPLPEQPQALFVGVLELYKGIDVLAEAWRLAVSRVPKARLKIVGTGSRASIVESLVGDRVSWARTLTSDEVARALDESTALVLPSRSEGMGRVVLEAHCRGRAVIGSRVGGIPDLVHDGENGLLVDPDDAAGLADTLERVLADPALASRLGASGREGVSEALGTPKEYAARLRLLLDGTLLNSEP
jgi:glycosyltransferase involved in cell wall biosynthesis